MVAVLCLEHGLGCKSVCDICTKSQLKTYPLSLPAGRPGSAASFGSLTSLLLCVEHQAEHIVTELRELETHSLELVFGLVSQYMASRRPECRDWLPDALVVDAGLLVDETRVCNLALGCRLCKVNLLVCKCCELGKTKLLRKCVDSGVAQKTNAIVVG